MRKENRETQLFRREEMESLNYPEKQKSLYQKAEVLRQGEPVPGCRLRGGASLESGQQ